VERPEDVNAPELITRLAALQPDLVLSVSCDQIFRRAFLAGIGAPVVNIHAGDPSRVRGRAVLTWQLLEGCTVVDLCAVLVDRRIDAGPVLARRAVDLPAEVEYGAALQAVSAQVPALLEALPPPRQLAALAASSPPAETAPDAVYYPRRLPGDEWVDWNRSSGQVLRLVRALAPPNCQARTLLGDRPLILLRAEAARPGRPAAGAPGSVIGRRGDGALLVRCGDASVWITGLLAEDGRPLGPIALSARFGSREDWQRLQLERRIALLEQRPVLPSTVHAVDAP
jgi:methionyl-tRNA formyltransferase